MASSLISGRPTSLAGSGHRSSAIIPAGGEFYDCVRFCAMFDKPYIARYERKAGKLFQLVGTFKDQATAGPGNGKRSNVVIPYDLIRPQTREERCSWCGKRGTLVLCLPACGEMVCAAGVTESEDGQYFRCRKSCGHEGWVNALIQTQAFDVSKKPEPYQTLLSSGGLDRLRLSGNGSAAALVPGQLRLKS